MGLLIIVGVLAIAIVGWFSLSVYVRRDIGNLFWTTLLLSTALAILLC